MRRLLAFGAALSALLGFTTAVAGAAFAYPVGTQAQIKVSVTGPFIGETIEISGSHYHPNEAVKIYVNNKFVATAHTDSTGAFDPPYKVLGPVGQQPVKGVGASGAADDIATTMITVQASASSSGSGSGLSSTGVQIALLTAAALALLVVGGLATRVGRRRKSVV